MASVSSLSGEAHYWYTRANELDSWRKASLDRAAEFPSGSVAAEWNESIADNYRRMALRYRKKADRLIRRALRKTRRNKDAQL